MASRILIKWCLVDDKGRWTVRARFSDSPKARPRLHSKSTGFGVNGNNKRKAEAAARDIVEQWERQVNGYSVTDENVTLGQCLDSWLQTKEKSLRVDTYESYKAYIRKHIKPKLGHITLKDLKRQDIQSYFNSLDGILSPNTMRKHDVIIRGALKSAVLDGVLTSDKGNVLTMVSLPKKKKFEGRSLTDEEIKAVMGKLADEPEPTRSAVVLGLCYGLRRSEICGLRWQDVDFDTNTLHICNTVTDYGGIITEGEQTKTLASRRDLTMIPYTVTYLKSLREQRIQQDMVSDKVCAYEDGRAVKPDYISRSVKTFLGKCGVDNVRLHDLRHTAASVLVKRMPVIYVSGFLGHNQVSTTLNIYSHVLDAERDKASNEMGQYLEKVLACSESCSEK
jgi:integrase